jgi:hypothetical protein
MFKVGQKIGLYSLDYIIKKYYDKNKKHLNIVSTCGVTDLEQKIIYGLYFYFYNILQENYHGIVEIIEESRIIIFFNDKFYSIPFEFIKPLSGLDDNLFIL